MARSVRQTETCAGPQRSSIDDAAVWEQTDLLLRFRTMAAGSMGINFTV